MPVTYADLVAVWGAGNVVRLPAIGPEFAQLPDGAQCVLTEVGVPKEAEMRARDPRAFSDQETWWSVIFEQMKAGLL